MCRLYGIVCNLFWTRLIFPRLNSSNVSKRQCKRRVYPGKLFRFLIENHPLDGTLLPRLFFYKGFHCNSLYCGRQKRSLRKGRKEGLFFLYPFCTCHADCFNYAFVWISRSLTFEAPKVTELIFLLTISIDNKAKRKYHENRCNDHIRKNALIFKRILSTNS